MGGDAGADDCLGVMGGWCCDQAESCIFERFRQVLKVRRIRPPCAHAWIIQFVRENLCLIFAASGDDDLDFGLREQVFGKQFAGVAIPTENENC